MTDAQLLELAEAAGFCAAVIPVEQVPVDAKFRAFCQENRCGQYNANYSCPPECGTVEQMHQRILFAEKALVLQTQWDIDGYGDLQGIRRGKDAHNSATLRLAAKLQAMGYETLCVGSSCCSLCETCKCCEGEPCVHPDLRYSCMSAYCVDVAKLAQLCGLAFAWDTKKLYPYGMIVLRERSK